jgi:hypothetical protein
MKKPRARSRGMVRQLLQSGLVEAYRLDAAAVLAFALIGVSVYRLAPDLLWGYAGAVLLLIVFALGKVAPSATEKQH